MVNHERFSSLVIFSSAGVLESVEVFHSYSGLWVISMSDQVTSRDQLRRPSQDYLSQGLDESFSAGAFPCRLAHASRDEA